MERETWSRRGGGLGRCIFKIVIAKAGGGGYNFHLYLIFFLGGGNFDTPHFSDPPPPLWDVINDQSLKRLINRKLVSEEV